MSVVEDARFYQVRVLRGLFSAANTDKEKQQRVKEFVHTLYEEHFTGKQQKIFQLIHRYFFLTYKLVSPSDFIDAIKASEDATDATVYEYQQLFLSYRFGDVLLDKDSPKPDGSASHITDAEFTYALDRLRTQTQIDLYGNALADTMGILVSGKTIDRKFVKGFPDARQFYAQQLVLVEHVGGTQLPAGNVSEEAEEIKKEYAAAKHGESTLFQVFTGVREIDELTGGGAPGEMWILSGYTAEGKTTECINVTYNAMLNGQNVVFGTAETLREQVRRRLISRHSIHPKFGQPHGIAGDAMKKGKLTSDEEKLFFDVVDDLATNTSYGKFKIVQIPQRCTTDYFAALLATYESEFYIHVAVWDELRLAGAGYRRSSRREELNDIITDAKQMAVSHRHQDDSHGILLLAPYQVSRGNWQEAVKSGHYTKACLSETSEAEKTADLIWSHLQIQDSYELSCQVLKYRDGSDRAPEFHLEWRPEVCYIGSIASEHDDLLD